MKAIVYIVKRLAAAGLVAALCASAAAAQEERGRLRLDALDRLAPQATETVRVEVDGGLVNFACALLSDSDPEERQVKEMCVGLKGVYVRGLKFREAGRPAEADVAALREQLRGWTQLVDISSRYDGLEQAEVYAASEGGRVRGLALLFINDQELKVINVVGDVDLDKLRRLGATFNLPTIRIERKRRNVVKTKPQQ
ncbi:MAG TPA: DUF4252 domain-containing protein [Pyrinomonadaceae bacterium]|nr:DUF4252 domain-containing protein [Pyrinomonadaceae bacterium]